jgi:hypothetical protein
MLANTAVHEAHHEEGSSSRKNDILDDDDDVPAGGPSTLPPPAVMAHMTSGITPAASPSDIEAASKGTADIYDRFSPRKKSVITAIVSFAALLARASRCSRVYFLSHRPSTAFASSSFLPSIPQIAHDLNVSESVVNYTVAVYLVCIGIA